MYNKISLKNKRVFVTGASGKIGRKLLEHLLNKGFTVVALVRNKINLPLKHPNLKIIEADILQVRKFIEEIRNCDYVFHLAVHQNIADPDKNKFIQVNVEGTRLILDAIVKSRVKRFIYLSTIMVFKPAGEKEIDENSPKKSSGEDNYYVDTKLSALRVIEEYSAKVPVIILYPTIVIDLDEIMGKAGKPPSGWQGFLWKAIGGGVPGGLMCMIGDKNRMMNYILIDNLLTVMANAMNKGKTGDDFILGGENIIVENYLRQVLRIKQRLFLPIRIPFFALKIISLINIPAFKVIDFIVKNPPENMRVNSQKACSILGLKIGRLKDF